MQWRHCCRRFSFFLPLLHARSMYAQCSYNGGKKYCALSAAGVCCLRETQQECFGRHSWSKRKTPGKSFIANWRIQRSPFTFVHVESTRIQLFQWIFAVAAYRHTVHATATCVRALFKQSTHFPYAAFAHDNTRHSTQWRSQRICPSLKLGRRVHPALTAAMKWTKKRIFQNVFVLA